jgi:putative redox protein
MSEEIHEAVVRGSGASYTQQIDMRSHRILADEPRELNGADLGPSPYELLLSALGACTSMTIAMYAKRKEWPVGDITVRLTHRKVDAAQQAGARTQAGKIDLIEREIELGGPLDDEMRQRLLEIANRCPVHRSLTGEILVTSRLAE